MLCEIFVLDDGRMVEWRAQEPHIVADPDLEAAIRARLNDLYPLTGLAVTPVGPFLDHPTVKDPDAVELALSTLGVHFIRLDSPADAGGVVT